MRIELTYNGPFLNAISNSGGSVMMRWLHEFPWLSLPLSLSLSLSLSVYIYIYIYLSICPYHSSLPAGLLDYIMSPYRTVVGKF